MNLARKTLAWMTISALALAVFVPCGRGCDDATLIPYRTGGGYTRDGICEWWIHNTTNETRLFQNGVYISSEFGTNDIGLAIARQTQANANGVTVGLVDIGSSTRHGAAMMVDLLTNIVAPGCSLIFKDVGSYTPWNIAAGIDYCRTNGAQIIVIGYGTSADDPSLRLSCQQTNDAEIPLFVPMREDGVNLNVDSFPDYPSSYAATMPFVVPVTGTDRNGQRHPATGYGINSIAAPFRNIAAAGVYESGTSYSAPIAAGLCALVAARFPHQSPRAWLSALQQSAHPVAGSRRVDAVGMLAAPVPRLTLANHELTVHAPAEFRYVVESSLDLKCWADFVEVNGGGSVPVPATDGFYRARVK